MYDLPPEANQLWLKMFSGSSKNVVCHEVLVVFAALFAQNFTKGCTTGLSDMRVHSAAIGFHRIPEDYGLPRRYPLHPGLKK